MRKAPGYDLNHDPCELLRINCLDQPPKSTGLQIKGRATMIHGRGQAPDVGIDSVQFTDRQSPAAGGRQRSAWRPAGTAGTTHAAAAAAVPMFGQLAVLDAEHVEDRHGSRRLTVNAGMVRWLIRTTVLPTAPMNTTLLAPPGGPPAPPGAPALPEALRPEENHRSIRRRATAGRPAWSPCKHLGQALASLLLPGHMLNVVFLDVLLEDGAYRHLALTAGGIARIQCRIEIGDDLGVVFSSAVYVAACATMKALLRRTDRSLQRKRISNGSYRWILLAL